MNEEAKSKDLDAASDRSYESGWDALRSNRVLEALSIAYDLQAQDVKNPKILNLLGCSLVAAGRDNEALPVFATASAHDPENEGYFLRMVKQFVVCGYPLKALGRLDARITDGDPSCWIWFYRAIVQFRLNRQAEAFESFLTHLEAAGDVPSETILRTCRGVSELRQKPLLAYLLQHKDRLAQNLSFVLVTTDLALQLRAYENARDLIQTGKSTYPQNEILEALAIDYLTATGSWGESFRRAQLAYQAATDSEHIVVAFARVNWITGKIKEAFELCKEAYLNNPTFFRSLSTAGEILMSTGAFQSALSPFVTSSNSLARSRPDWHQPKPVPPPGFDMADQHLLIQLGYNLNFMCIALPLIHRVIDVAEAVILVAPPECKLFMHLLFPGCQVITPDEALTQDHLFQYLDINFEDLVPFALVDEEQHVVLPAKPLSFPAYKTDIALRQCDLSSERPTIAVDETVLDELNEMRGADTQLEQTLGHIDLLELSFTPGIAPPTRRGSQLKISTLEDLAAVLLNCEHVIARRGPVAYLASSLGVSTWLIDAEQGLPRWYMFNFQSPSPLNPSLNLIRREMGDSNADLLKKAFEAVGAL